MWCGVLCVVRYDGVVIMMDLYVFSGCVIRFGLRLLVMCMVRLMCFFMRLMVWLLIIRLIVVCG